MSYQFILYITGTSHRGYRAVETMRGICDMELEGDATIEVIDVLSDPQAAEAARVVATPTLIKVEPRPERRILGDLSDREAVLASLDIRSNAGLGPVE